MSVVAPTAPTAPRASLTFSVYHLFSGSGGGALGFKRAQEEWRGIRGHYRTLGGADVDAEACEDFRMFTDVGASVIDLFNRQDYIAFHGTQPPEGWREATPADLRASAGGETPDVVFLSPPCKGLSALLPKAQAESEKYTALNRLTVRGIALALEAWRDDLPALIVLENVPRIRSRGEKLLNTIKSLLGHHGYVVTDDTHDLGEIGGLAQHRTRYLLVARNPAKVPYFLYQPPKRPVRSIGSELEKLPVPIGSVGGPMHELPRLQFITWQRLALVHAGGDWRDLCDCEPGSFSIEPLDSDLTAIADGQPHLDDGAEHFGHTYRVVRWNEAAGTVTAARAPGAGAACVAEPRLAHVPRDGSYRVNLWNLPSQTITGSARVGVSNGVAAVAEPRLGYTPHRGAYRVAEWNQPATAIIGSASPRGSNGLAAVAEVRLHTHHGANYKGSPGLYGVIDWNAPAPAVTGSASVSGSNMPAAVAEPRIPQATDRNVYVIIAEDGTWHRPLSTLELAALQGFPVQTPDGEWLVMAGLSHQRWRERIGNSVPVDAAEAIGGMMLLTLIASRIGQRLYSVYATAIWVDALERAIYADPVRRVVAVARVLALAQVLPRGP